MTEMSLSYYRARYYDPNVGRFLSEDPIQSAGDDLNLYPYVAGDPIDWVDHDGDSRDVYVPDTSGKHGGPHVDRYTPQGQNVGRYQKDGTPIKHGKKTPPPVPNADREKFKKAADKLPCENLEPTPLNIPPGYDCSDDGCTRIHRIWPPGPSFPWPGAIPLDPIPIPIELPGPIRIPVFEFPF